MVAPAALLDFEAAHPGQSRTKETIIRRELGLTPARYYVLLHRAAQSLEGWEHDPITAKRVLDRELRRIA